MEANSFDSIRSRFRQDVEDYNRGKGEFFNTLLRGAILGELLRACGGSQERRDTVLRALVHTTEPGNMQTGKWYALYKFVDPHYDHNNKTWKVRDGLYEECAMIVAHEEERQRREEQTLEELGVVWS